MRADREKRAVILTAEGQRQAAILTAEGSKQSAILNAEGDREALILRAQADRESQILRAQGEGQAIQTVFQAIHDGQPDQSLLAYQYLQMMPRIAEGDANKVWVIPSRDHQGARGPRLLHPRDRRHPTEDRRAAQAGRHGPHASRRIPEAGSDPALSSAQAAVEAAIAEAANAEMGGTGRSPVATFRAARQSRRRSRPQSRRRSSGCRAGKSSRSWSQGSRPARSTPSSVRGR